MGHHHHHSHSHAHAPHSQSSSKSGLLFAFGMNLLFALVEFIGGALTNSVAIMSNALHDLGDAFSLGLSWYLEKVAEQKRDHRYSYGYRRFSVLGALITSGVLVAGSIVVLAQAIPRLIHPEPVSLEGMIWFAVLGLAVNIVAALRIRRGQSLNEKMVWWHLMEDILGWSTVLLVGLGMRLWDLPILDPLLSILITLFVLYNVVGRTRETLRVFLQAVPDRMQISEIEKHILHTPHVESVHHTRVWSLDGEQHILTTHIVLKAGVGLKQVFEIKRQIKEHLREFSIFDVTIEVEFASENCASPE